MSTISKNKILSYVASKDVSLKTKDDLSLFCYTKQYFYKHKDFWDDIVINCRGIVFNNNGIVSRPIKKIFNIGENGITLDYVKNRMLEEKYNIYDKANGHLAIAFQYNNEMVVTTKGSFDSDFAIPDKELCFNTGINELLNIINDQSNNMYFTVCMEVIADYDKHTMHDEMVKNYGNNTVVVLAIVDNFTGDSIPYDVMKSYCSHLDIPVIKKYDLSQDLESMFKEKDREGYVIHFTESDERIKVKCDEYWEARKRGEGISAKKILKHMSKQGHQGLYRDFDEELYPIFDYISLCVPKYIESVTDLDFCHDFISNNVSRKEISLSNQLTDLEKSIIMYYYLGNSKLIDIRGVYTMFCDDVKIEEKLQHYIDNRWLSDIIKRE